MLVVAHARETVVALAVTSQRNVVTAAIDVVAAANVAVAFAADDEIVAVVVASSCEVAQTRLDYKMIGRANEQRDAIMLQAIQVVVVLNNRRQLLKAMPWH